VQACLRGRECFMEANTDNQSKSLSDTTVVSLSLQKEFLNALHTSIHSLKPYMVSWKPKLYLHRRRFLAKPSTILCCDCGIQTFFDPIGQSNTIRYYSICVTSPKVLNTNRNDKIAIHNSGHFHQKTLLIYTWVGFCIKPQSFFYIRTKSFVLVSRIG
jgi:hypothetical protein